MVFSSTEDINKNKDQSTMTDENEADNFTFPEKSRMKKKGSVVFTVQSPTQSESDQDGDLAPPGEDSRFKNYAQIAF